MESLDDITMTLRGKLITLTQIKADNGELVSYTLCDDDEKVLDWSLSALEEDEIALVVADAWEDRQAEDEEADAEDDEDDDADFTEEEQD